MGRMKRTHTSGEMMDQREGKRLRGGRESEGKREVRSQRSRSVRKDRYMVDANQDRHVKRSDVACCGVFYP